MTNYSKTRDLNEGIFKKFGKLIASGAFLAFLATLTFAYQVYSDSEERKRAERIEVERRRVAEQVEAERRRVAEKVEAERRRVAEQTEAERRRFVTEQNDRLMAELQAAREVQQEYLDLQKQVPEAQYKGTPTVQALPTPEIVAVDEPTIEPAPERPSAPDNQVAALDQRTIHVFNTLGREEFELCGHPGFQIAEKTALIAITNRHRDFKYRDEPAFSMALWQTTVQPGEISEVFPGCSIKVSPKTNFTTTYYIISEIYTQGA